MGSDCPGHNTATTSSSRTTSSTPWPTLPKARGSSSWCSATPACGGYSDVCGQLILGTPKSHQSRTVPIPRFLARELMAATSAKHADDLVFTTRGGHALRLSNWRRAAFLPACAKTKVSDQFRIHDLRHTAASLMIQAGYPPKMLQEIMGHASITTTVDLYGHLYPGDMDRYADRLDEAAVAKMRPDEPLDGSDDEPTAP